jgi:hypothetical protein
MVIFSRQEGWPDVISKEVNECFDGFLGNTYTTIGLISGKTLLPLPHQIDLFVSNAQREKINREKERCGIFPFHNESKVLRTPS